jgi:hypothetical protein
VLPDEKLHRVPLVANGRITQFRHDKFPLVPKLHLGTRLPSAGVGPREIPFRWFRQK